MPKELVDITPVEKSTFKCHVCSQPFTIVKDDRNGKGVMLRCDTREGCIPHENVYGFGGSEKEAAETAKHKYKV
jgi:hypothetical protein